MGLTPAQRLFKVELPLALPALLGGLRVASVTVVSAATVAARGHRLERDADMRLAIGFSRNRRQAAEPELVGCRIADGPFAGPLGQFHQGQFLGALLDLAD